MFDFNRRNTLIAAAIAAVIVGVGGVLALYAYNDEGDMTSTTPQTQQQTPAQQPAPAK